MSPKLQEQAQASIVTFLEAQKLDDKLMLGAPAPSQQLMLG